MLEAFPYVPLGGNVRVGVAIYSYDGALGFGVTGDDDTAPDIGVLCAGIERGMAESCSPRRGSRARRAAGGAPAVTCRDGRPGPRAPRSR